MMTQDRLTAIEHQISVLMQIYSQRRKLVYTVRPSEHIAEKDISELRQMRFWVGFQGVGSHFNLDEIVVIFRTTFDAIKTVESVQRSHPGTTNLKLDPVINLEPTDETIKQTISEIGFSEPE